jgi:hypothetical protein
MTMTMMQYVAPRTSALDALVAKPAPPKKKAAQTLVVN